ncbi:NAD-dependent succinate-semialdehyde dehydrogenase [Aliidiomarina quisquiliarum]|uniref:NAD-dependent succinate-semialdehyde dehydrogenase n=1 Tax=Aliidiomarina quisquiliarum TaxID=2938947 RepID=UPI00208F23AE|nr:NAD-dependent succinate-semialdehyde dehydrogenase [Aliidiomarina quisquiliarum]MCO4321348.1 NAD-dependent succinate-semialdehyde dehydrogenase [Aliidiomarina quisquiliarum]
MPLSHAAKQLIHNQCLINGTWVSALSGDTITVRDPATNAAIVNVPALSDAEIEQSIQAATAAGSPWRAKSSAERGLLLRAWFDLVMLYQTPLAQIMTLEQGKPLAEAKAEIAYAASYIEWYAEEAKRNYGETIPGPNSTTRIVVTREPVGVCAAITPWNFPAAMITRKVAPALAAGCTIIVKPASETPLTALALADLAIEAGIPAGVLNVVTGSAKSIGKVLTSSPNVRKLSFTGSTAVGALLMAQSAPTVKRVSLELGGNAPFIVFDDADIQAAAQGVIDSKFRNAGQTCVCANRIYVQRNIYPQFVAALKEKVTQLKVGNGFEQGVAIGPLINPAAVEKVQAHIADALKQGGELLLGGKPHMLGGNWFEPTIIGNVPQTALCAKEETFGPFAPLFIFDTDEEVIAWANDTEFGLAAYFYASNIHRVYRIADALEAGMVGINTGLISNASAPFGGVKSSGIGREGGRQGLEEYTELKYMCFGSV